MAFPSQFMLVAAKPLPDGKSAWRDSGSSGKAMVGRVRDKTFDGVKAADELVRDNPYQTLAIAFGVGAVIGFLLGRRDRG
jgi:ElaB/YqjD/DUF883 family membrane-anchored ribosome-binding protein